MLKLKNLRLLFTFYSSFFAATFLITLASVGLLAYLGMSAFTVVFWFKVITLGMILYYIQGYKKKEFMYYQNLGMSRTFLWLSVVGLDLGLFFFLLIITMKMI